METALDFQQLIQKAYDTARLGMHEADTDLYRRYEEALKKYEEGIAAQSPDLPELAFKAGKKTGKIVMSLQRAFHHVLHTTQAPMSREQADAFEALSLLLMEDTTQTAITRAISEGNRLLDEIGVESLR
jgi:hypothetical protein